MNISLFSSTFHEEIQNFVFVKRETKTHVAVKVETTEYNTFLDVLSASVLFGII